MNSSKLDAIFFNFELVDELSDYEASDNRRNLGTGMGLAIVARIVKVLHGQLKVESILDQGTTVTISFTFDLCDRPVLTKEREVVDTEVELGSQIKTSDVAQGPALIANVKDATSSGFLPATPSLERKFSDVSGIDDLSQTNLEILVADDDPINRNILFKRLKSLGHVTTLTNDGVECFGAYQGDPSKFAAILMDIQMPILDGMAATQQVRNFEKTAAHSNQMHIPIIAISASLLK